MYSYFFTSTTEYFLTEPISNQLQLAITNVVVEEIFLRVHLFGYI